MHYAINQIIFLTNNWQWFGIYDLYAIKRIMQLIEFDSTSKITFSENNINRNYSKAHTICLLRNRKYGKFVDFD